MTNKEWFISGKPHLEDGPAKIDNIEWWVVKHNKTECNHPEMARYVAGYNKQGCYKCGSEFEIITTD